VESPPGAYNWVIASKGREITPQPGANGAYYESAGQFDLPASLYEEQLKERLAWEKQSGSR
jgi:hypothetical protein